LTLAGIVLGIAAAFGLSKLVRAMLYGITGADPATYAAVALVLAAVSIAACYSPA
jgi:putative ABC transport system permease protein